ncbi:ATP-binding cassette sub-family G member 8 [Biomphalaria pfeifferi]|uniref:ATP-binding cassette sub-family G member 8 n=1 Tax=Biomphalaria pfeifferi TaxID=112525 RepID=A0AAD8BHP9_BIOPF|nr:ATP-binding cassette sub-family G member 8 [Biomphalaria pfeifferi]
MERQASGSDRLDAVIDLIGPHTTDIVPIDLHVDKLSYTVTDVPGSWWQKITNIQMPWEWMEKGKTTEVLKDVSFTAKSGQLMAVMGGSGSGKTSLLDVLACRTSSGVVTGDVYLNSVVRTKTILDSCAGYVRQDDRLIAFLTVRETLIFVAQLKLPRTFNRAMIRNRVDLVIAELGLTQAADTKVGNDSIRGLSGGERRRVSIGIQLLILPSVLFLDEPTSGLDSFTANSIIKTLSRLASKHRTIIMSIHQPRFDIFNTVDTMMLLSKGSIVFNGPAKEMVNYFTSLGYPCPEHMNPCDYYIDLTTVDNTSPEREDRSLAVVQRLHEAFKSKQEEHTVVDLNKQEAIDTDVLKGPARWSKVLFNTLQGKRVTEDDTLQNLIDAMERQRASPGLGIQFFILFRRFIRVTLDDYLALLTHVIQALLMSLLLGLAYISLKLDQVSIRDWFGVMFMMSVMYPYMVILGLIGTCHEERRFIYFELQDKLYHPAALYFAKVLSDVPFHLVYVLIYIIPLYFMAGLSMDAYTVCMFALFVGVSVFTSRCLAMMSAAILPTYQIASFFSQTLFSLFIMSAGFLINLRNIISETRWISDLSYLRWGFQALCLIEIKNLKFQCDEKSPSCVKDGNDALLTYALEGGELWQCALGLGGTMIFFLIVMFLGLRFVPQKPHNE